ncbi:uncharacterized protein [Saccopteryx bilineata]|uniref:uncharacterized protein isoform X2 n=1 Tax=Saccopteryx bilineata TaxID=59482 RepID=UPI00338F0E72
MRAPLRPSGGCRPRSTSPACAARRREGVFQKLLLRDPAPCRSAPAPPANLFFPPAFNSRILSVSGRGSAPEYNQAEDAQASIEWLGSGHLWCTPAVPPRPNGNWVFLRGARPSGPPPREERHLGCELANGRRGRLHNVERLQNVNTAGRATAHVYLRAARIWPQDPPGAARGHAGGRHARGCLSCTLLQTEVIETVLNLLFSDSHWWLPQFRRGSLDTPRRKSGR